MCTVHNMLTVAIPSLKKFCVILITYSNVFNFVKKRHNISPNLVLYWTHVMHYSKAYNETIKSWGVVQLMTRQNIEVYNCRYSKAVIMKCQLNMNQILLY